MEVRGEKNNQGGGLVKQNANTGKCITAVDQQGNQYRIKYISPGIESISL